MSEYKFLIFLVIAVIFLMIHLFSVWLNKDSYEYFDGTGTITRINMDDYGDTWFYIDINVGGTVYSTQSDTYRKKPDNIKKGDVVKIKYCYIKGNDVRCYITQDGFERVIQENQNKKPIMLYIAIVCFLIFAFMLVKTLLKF